MRVEFSEEAASDIERIADYIARDNPRRALTFVRELREKCETLSATPTSFPVVPRYERFGIRRRIHGAYLIFYRLEENRVVIVHVLHGAMDYTSILSGD